MDTNPLYQVMECVCPLCSGELTLVEVGGDVQFLDDHFDRKDVVEQETRVRLVSEHTPSRSELQEAMLHVLDCPDSELDKRLAELRRVMDRPAITRVKRTPVSVRRRPAIKPEWVVPDGAVVSIWTDRDPEQYGSELGMFMYRCKSCTKTQEAYELWGGDWVLAGEEGM